MEIDVEADEIGEVDGQIFGRREVGVTDKRPAVRRSHTCDEAPNKAAHRLDAVPAHHVRGDLIADEITEDAGMAAAFAYPGDHRFPDLGLGRSAVEKCNVLRPGKSDQKFQTRSVSGVEQPKRWRSEDPHGIYSGFAHQREILVDHRRFRKWRAVSSRCEGA